MHVNFASTVIVTNRLGITTTALPKREQCDPVAVDASIFVQQDVSESPACNTCGINFGAREDQRLQCERLAF